MPSSTHGIYKGHIELPDQNAYVQLTRFVGANDQYAGS